MSVRSRRLAVAGVITATMIAVPAAALASAPGTSSGKPAPSVAASESAAASKSAVRQSGALRNVTLPAMVTALATQLGVSHSAAQRTFGQLDVLSGPGGVDVAEGAQQPYFASADDGGHQVRVYTAAMPGESGAGLVRTSRAADADDGALRNAALLLAGLTIGAAGVTYGAARLTAGSILRPIAELTATAEHVTQTRDLTARLPSTGPGDDGTSDEVGRLSSSFDTMLAALHESVTGAPQRQLVADASHELRTPLTSLTTNLDLLEDGAGAIHRPGRPAGARPGTGRPGSRPASSTS
jgi:two-component system sensor histidine kinase MprB